MHACMPWVCGGLHSALAPAPPCPPPPCNLSTTTCTPHKQVVLDAVDKPRSGVQSKGSSADLVTATDVASEAAVLAVIQKAFPGHAVLGEEGGVSGECACLLLSQG